VERSAIRSWVGYALVASLIVGTVYMVASFRADSRHESEQSFQHGFVGILSILSGVALAVAYAFLGRGSVAPVPVAPAPESAYEGIGIGGTLASVSVLAAVLCWLPLLPVMSPIAMATTAVLTGLFGLRALRGRAGRVRDRATALAGTALGSLYFLLYVVVSWSRR
jgi:hypothetical protein